MTDQYFHATEHALRLGKFSIGSLFNARPWSSIGRIYFRAQGGKDAEKEERQRWENADRKRIMDSVYGKHCLKSDSIRLRNFNFNFLNSFDQNAGRETSTKWPE